MNANRMSQKEIAPSSWWLVLCLIGLDYFSTLAYLPSLAIEAAGALAPFAALLVVAATILAALPVYLYVVGRSPHGRGGAGVLERLVPGWAGKLLVLLILAFMATDYVVTQNLSIADAAEHLGANPYFRSHVDPYVTTHFHPERWSALPLWQRGLGYFDRQLVLTLLLSVISFSLWAWWRSGSARLFLRVAAVVVVCYLALNAIVIGSGLAYLAGDGRHVAHEWFQIAKLDLHDMEGTRSAPLPALWRLLRLALVAFPYVALGLSGFELSMAVVPLVRGNADDNAEVPRGRIRNMRKLLIVATAIMTVGLLGSVTVAATLIPLREFHEKGAAVHRASWRILRTAGLAIERHGGQALR